uniref:DUF4817 domain-containing protein n=1 Tax=Acrobeloides nanus TaxID=290746 RepID=A0A914CCW9_9BILA
MDYTVQQKIWTVIWYGMHGQPKKVQIEYRKKFGRKAKAPSRKTIHDWWLPPQSIEFGPIWSWSSVSC